jgi:sporulation protein YlmC with PRC-barrel domain
MARLRWNPITKNRDCGFAAVTATPQTNDVQSARSTIRVTGGHLFGSHRGTCPISFRLPGYDQSAVSAVLASFKKDGGTMATLNDPSDTRGRLIAASQVNGTTVYNLQGEKLGSIYDVILDKPSGHAEYAIMSFGGFLGIGDEYHPLPWKALTYDPVQGGYVVDIDRRRLEAAPSYGANERGMWDDPDYGRRVTDYYGGMLTY